MKLGPSRLAALVVLASLTLAACAVENPDITGAPGAYRGTRRDRCTRSH